MIRKFTVAVLLACYGGGALVGPGLHQLLGCEHDHAVATAADGDSTPSHRAEPSSADGHHRHGAGDDEHDCPVCKLLAMPQSAVAHVAHDWVVAGIFRRVVFSRGPALAAPLPSFQIRGPPTI